MLRNFWPPLPPLEVTRGIARPLVQRYVRAVETGAFRTGTKQRQAVARFQADLTRWRMDWEAADRICSFFPWALRHTTGQFAGEPFHLRPFQAFVVSNLFGFKLPDGRRRFREAHICMGRGNGKSPLAGALSAYLAFYDGEARATVYNAATKRDQARAVFGEVCRFCEHPDSPLAGAIKVQKTSCSIQDGSLVEVLSADRNQDSLIPYAIVLDELHAWREHYRDMYDKLLSGMGKRKQPLTILITTAGDDLSEIWLERYDYSRLALEGQIEADEHFAFVCEIDRDADIHDPENWVCANPMLQDPDSPVQTEYLEIESRKAQVNPAAEHRFRRYHANQVTHAVEHLFAPGEWERGNDWIEPEADTAGYGAFDLGRANDFAAVAVALPVADGFALEAWTFTTEVRSELLQSADFDALIGQSHLIVHEGDQVDFSAILQHILQVAEMYWIAEWGYDPAWATVVGALLENEHGMVLKKIPQTGVNFNEPILRMHELVRAGRLYHAGEPTLSWQARNFQVKISSSTDLRQPHRRGRGQKIDAIVAGPMALLLAIQNEAGPRVSFYDENSLEFI